MKEMAQQNRETALFLPEDNNQYGQAKSAIEKSRNRQLKELFNAGFAMHHAGMLRESICQLIESSSRELRSTMPNMDPMWMLVSWTSSRYLAELVDLSLTSLAMVSSSLPMTNLLTICLF